VTPPKGSNPTPRRRPSTPAPRKPAARKPAARKATPARRSTSAPRATAAVRTPTARKPAARKPAARKPAPRTPAARPAKARARSKHHLPATRLLGAFVASVLVVGFLLVAVFPTRTLLTQRSDTGKAQSELTDLQKANAQLTQRIAKLGTDAEVERIAREEFGMTRPGEEAYAVLPAPEDPVVLPEVWPFAGAADELNR
jgi:cell division protein FtsL